MSANYTPTRGEFYDLKPFRYWCYQILPLSYDDSLSYYELLCKVVDALNKSMEDIETLNDDMEGLYTAYDELQDYVNHYFDSLDITTEINHKLDTMAANGTLGAVIAPYIPTPVTAWLNEHVTSGDVVVDDSLTIEEAAADAAAAGRWVRHLNDNFNLNYNNVCFDQYQKTATSGGVTYTHNANGTYTVTGTQSGTSYMNLSDPTAMTPGIQPGKTYFTNYYDESNTVTFEVWADGTRILGLSTPYFFTVPENALVVYFRLATWNASGINTTVTLPVVSTLEALDGGIVLPPDFYGEYGVGAGATSTLIKAASLSNVRLTEGEYNVNIGVSLPAGRQLIGNGIDKTIVNYTGAGEYLIGCANGGERVSNMTLNGGLSARPESYNPVSPVSGISVGGDDLTHAPTYIDNMKITGFSKNGVLVTNKGYVALNSIVMNNVYLNFNGCGICLGFKGEYALISNCVANDNYYGVVDSGGNNKISNCGFDRNYIGLFATNVGNDTHSDVMGCSFNHCIQWGIRIEYIVSVLNFIGCQIFAAGYADVSLYQNQCVTFTSCLFGASATLAHWKAQDADGLAMYSNCIFASAPTFYNSGSLPIHVNNCYQQDGTAVTLT